MEEIYEDAKAWTYFEGEYPEEIIGVYRRCPNCGRYITKGRLLMNLNGDVKLKNWKCKNHGGVSEKVFFDRDFETSHH